MELKKITRDNTTFYYVDVGSEMFGRPSFRLWVSKKLVKNEGKKESVIMMNAKIERTEKGNIVLRPDEKYWVANIFCRCGFRGTSSIEILEPDGVEVFPYRVYHSPRGNIGVSQGALVNVPVGKDLTYRWKRTGRLYGKAPNGLITVKSDGTTVNIDYLPDGIEALKEIEEL